MPNEFFVHLYEKDFFFLYLMNENRIRNAKGGSNAPQPLADDVIISPIMESINVIQNGIFHSLLMILFFANLTARQKTHYLDYT